MAIIFIKSLSTQSRLTRRFFSSVRALGVALIVIAALLSSVDADALTRSKVTKYGTLSYTTVSYTHLTLPTNREV